jgi:hypothetical protein
MIMRNALALSLIVLLAFAGGCKQNSDQTSGASATVQALQAEHELTPEQLGELGAQIRKTPDRAGELLSKHGLTEQTFEAQIRKVTENADAAKRYAEAYRKASA